MELILTAEQAGKVENVMTEICGMFPDTFPGALNEATDVLRGRPHLDGRGPVYYSAYCVSEGRSATLNQFLHRTDRESVEKPLTATKYILTTKNAKSVQKYARCYGPP